MKFVTLDEVDSTNAEAKRLVETGERGPLWIKANSQTQGRGRRGREWVSESGNLYCSGLYPNSGPMQETAKMSFIAALAVADTLKVYIPSSKVSLKWPNDVLVNGKKVSGILLEGGADWFIVGIGINVTSNPSNTEYNATHLLEHIDEAILSGAEPIMTGTGAILATLSARFNHWRAVFLENGFSSILKAWLACASNIPGPVTVRLLNETFAGSALGLDENGALRVRLGNGTIRYVHAGDVFFGHQGA